MRLPRLDAARTWSSSADERGAVLVEFALIAPLLFALCFGVIQYGLALFVQNNMFDAAREGARSLAVGTWDETEAEAGAAALLVDWPSSWSIVAEDTGTTGTDQVRMVITVPGSEAGVLGILPMPGNLRAEVVMRKE